MKKSVYLSSLLVICLSLFSMAAKAQAPVVTTDPLNDTVCVTDTAWFRVVATGATPLTYMWEYSADGGTVWDTVENGGAYFWATNDTLGVIGHYTMNAYKYRAIVMNASGMDTSGVATLRVDTAYAGAISGAVPVCVGGSIMLSSSVAGGVWSNLHHAVDTTVPATGMVTGRAFGFDTVMYTVMNACGTSVSSAAIRVDTTPVAYPITGPTHVCVGNIITMNNVNFYGTRAWSVSNSNASISSAGVVTGLAAGLDTVWLTFSNGCGSVTSWKEITVETLPATGTISGPSAVCASSWIHLTSSVTGGVWLSGTPSVAVVNTAGDVTGLTHGTSVISYYRTNSCGAAYAMHTVTVDSPAAPISGNDSVGIDSTLMLSDIIPGGVWSSADTTIAKITSAGLVTGRDTGVTTITYSVTNSCGTSSATITMNVGPVPDAGTILGPDTVCVGGSITLTGSVVGGTWISKHDTLATIDLNTGVVSGIKYGQDTVYYYVTTAFGRSRIMKRLFVNSTPQFTLAAPASIAMGGSYTLTVNPASATGGTWTTNNPSMTALIGYGFFIVLDTGTSVFTYKRTNTCGTTTKTVSVHLAGVNSVNGVPADAASFSVYPNPSKGAVTVSIATEQTEKVDVVLTNVLGQVVSRYTISTNTPSDVVISQPAGMYTLTAVTANGNRYTSRISIN